MPLVFAQTDATAATEPLELINFLPEPDRILVQRDAGFPQLGDTRLTMVLSAAAGDELRKVTGRSDFAIIGSRDAQLILRDDGQGGNPVAGDGQFSTIVTLPVAGAEERQAEESQVLSRSDASDKELVFEGRTLTATKALTAGFDASPPNRHERRPKHEPKGHSYLERRPKPNVGKNGTSGWPGSRLSWLSSKPPRPSRHRNNHPPPSPSCVT